MKYKKPTPELIRQVALKSLRRREGQLRVPETRKEVEELRAVQGLIRRHEVAIVESV